MCYRSSKCLPFTFSPPFVLIVVFLTMSVFAVPPVAAQQQIVTIETDGTIDETLRHLFSGVDENRITSGILLDRVLPRVNIHEYDGSTYHDSVAVTPEQWRRIYYQLQASMNENASAPTTSSLSAPVESFLYEESFCEDEVIPVSILYYDFQFVHPEAFEEQALVYNETTERVEDGPNMSAPAFLLGKVFSASALNDEVEGHEFTFTFDLENYVSNIGTPDYLEVDPRDGGGFRTVNLGGSITVHYYNQEGLKVIRLKAHYGNTVEKTSFLLHVDFVPEPDFEECNVQASRTYNGAPVYYSYAYFYGFTDGVKHTSLKKPLIVVDGFDLDNTRRPGDLYELLNKDQGLADQMRDEGFDIVIVDYEDALDLIQKNSLSLVDMIERVRGEIGNSEWLTVIGPSMGGLVARYALLFMEDNGIPHNTKSFLSFDAVHQGANIPAAYQLGLYFADQHYLDLDELLSRFQKEAVKQMLAAYYDESDFNAGTATAEPHSLRTQLENDFEALGDYPGQPRNVAIAKGSGYAEPQCSEIVGLQGSCTSSAVNMQPGDEMLEAEVEVKFEIAYIIDIVKRFDAGKLWAVRDQAKGKVFEGRTIDLDYGWIYFNITITTYRRYVEGSRPYDNAPGSYRPTNKQAAMTADGTVVADIPRWAEFITGLRDILVKVSAENEVHSFVPTISALDLPTLDLFYNVYADPAGYVSENLDGTLSTGNFDAIYYASSNGNHTGITSEIEEFVFQQIFYAKALNLQLANTVVDETVLPYEARNSITAGSSFTIESGGDVTLRSGNSITLTAGFHAKKGSEFHAYIDPRLQGTYTGPSSLQYASSTSESSGVYTLAGTETASGAAAVAEDKHTAEEGFMVSQVMRSSAATRPSEFALKQNYPNPFSRTTTIEYALKDPTHVTLEVYNMLGQKVATIVDEMQQAGYKIVLWNGSFLPSGAYIYRIKAGGFVDTETMVLVR